MPGLARADQRCDPKNRAAYFSTALLDEQGPKEHYTELLRDCALPEVVELAKSLIALQTVSSEAASKAWHFAELGRTLSRWASARGLSFRTVGKNAVFEVGWGSGSPSLGLVFHADVVPAPASEWTKKPFSPVVEDGRLYGRGAEDNKGPLAAALVALAYAKQLGLAPSGKVLVIAGTGEESDWSGMKAYAKDQPRPANVVSVDASFPVVVAQSGFVEWELEALVGEPDAIGDAVALDAKAGEFLTQVPASAEVLLSPRGQLTTEQLARKVYQALSALRLTRKGLQVDVFEEAKGLRLRTHGKGVHSSTADQGENALWDLAAITQRLPLAKNGISEMLAVVARRFDQDHEGRRLGLSYEDELMGKLLVSPTLLRVKDGKVKLSVNMRRPQGKTKEAFLRSLLAAGRAIEEETSGMVRPSGEPSVGEPHVADTSGKLAPTLQAIYLRHRPGQDARLLSIRGGTYARLFPGAVDFGPSFPGEPYLGHAPDESISLDNLLQLSVMLGEAIYELGVAVPTARNAP